MYEKYEFVVKTDGLQSTVVVEARDKEEAILRLESRFGGLSLGDYYFVRRTVGGQMRWI